MCLHKFFHNNDIQSHATRQSLAQAALGLLIPDAHAIRCRRGGTVDEDDHEAVRCFRQVQAERPISLPERLQRRSVQVRLSPVNVRLSPVSTIVLKPRWRPVCDLAARVLFRVLVQ